MHLARASWTRYLWVWLGLLGLTALSFLLSLLHLGAVDVALALGIALGKTLLVLLFFMHLAGERFSIAIIPAIAAAFVVLLLALTSVDVATRVTFPKAPVPFVGSPLEVKAAPAGGGGERR